LRPIFSDLELRQEHRFFQQLHEQLATGVQMFNRHAGAGPAEP